MNFGILGYGKIVREEIAPAIYQAGHQICATGSRSNTRPDGFTGRVHGNYSDCINDSEVDAIYIATPNHLHVPLACEAMRAGKPVLCEKPIALSVAEFETLCAVQAETQVTLQEAFMVNHHPQWEQIRQQDLGNSGMLHTSFTYTPRLNSDVRSQSELGGGVWWDIGCYGLWACYQLGARTLESVSGIWKTNGEVCDQVQVTLGFAEMDAQIEVGARHFRQQSLQFVSNSLRLQMPRPFNPQGQTVNVMESDKGSTTLIHEANQYARMVQSFCIQIESGNFLDIACSRAVSQWSEAVNQQLT